jgi:polyisoprenoid-binding protein YceI
MILLLLVTCMISPFFLVASWAQAPTPAVYNIDAAKSRIELAVFRSGLLKIAGHDHVIEVRDFSGVVRCNSLKVDDSSVILNIESRSLVVVDPGASEKEREEVQATMLGAQVLNTPQFPKIQFRSTSISRVSNNGEDFVLTGQLLLHGVDKQIAFPMHSHREQNLLRASGTVTLAQTDFGIEPIKIGLGMIRVADKVQIKFDFLAESANP